MTSQLQRDMRIELVRLHAHALLRMPWVQLLLVVGLGLLLFPYAGPVKFLGWAATTIGVEIARARYGHRVLGLGTEFDPTPIHRRLVALAALAGGTLGLGGVLFLPKLPLLHQALFGAILFAIPAAGVAVSQSSRHILAAYALCMLPPSSLAWAQLHPSQAWSLLTLTVLYCGVLILVAADAEKFLLRSVVIRHERDRLVRDLEIRNERVHVAMTQAEQSAQARARVLAAASHDLRQPLQALSLYSAVLTANPDPASLPEISRNIDQIVRSLGNLLNGLLDLSRLSGGYYVPSRSDFALDQLVAQICSEYREAAHQKSLRLSEQLAPVRLHDDAVAIGRMIRNLLDNAIKYTEAGEIVVSLQRSESAGSPRALVCVSDTGKGIPVAETERIFEEFYQLDNPGRDRSRGVGLGLAIVKRLAELLGAKVTVHSTPGSGSRFELLLSEPLADAVRTEPDRAQAQDSGLRGVRAYVVDDEADILKSMRALLLAWGASVETAATPREASALFDRLGRPDVLIVDLRLGAEVHGADLANDCLRRYGPFQVVVVTGETSSEALRTANEWGFTLLQKPIAPETLRAALLLSASKPEARAA
jgi:signal transduction histidine kinase/CheY-like chemotaxis protein